MEKENMALRYRAPALEKGLDILELLAGEMASLTIAQVSDRLGRSKGEIFRMLQVLEERGYIARRPGEDGFSLTNRLFMLGVERPPMRGLLEVGLPIMHRLSESVFQSCHLAVASGERIVIIARVESPGAVGFSVRLGHKAPITGSNSGTVLLAWSAQAEKHPAEDPSNQTRFAAVRAAGHAMMQSPEVRGVIDLSAPVLQSGVAIAALTIPFVDTDDIRHNLDQALHELKRAAADISEAVRVGREGPLEVGLAAIERIAAQP